MQSSIPVPELENRAFLMYAISGFNLKNKAVYWLKSNIQAILPPITTICSSRFAKT